MRRRASDIPYFDVLLRQIDDRPSSEVVKAFGTRHVHWGYFESPRDADESAASLVRTSEALACRVCDAAAVGDGQCILDVGCGFGGTIASLNERFCRLTLTGLNI